MVKLADVAKVAGVSPMTVSNALRGKPNVSERTRHRVLQVADELGYRGNAMAKGLRLGATGVIGLAVPELDMPFPAHLAAEVTTVAARRHLRVMVQQTHSERDVELAIIRDSGGGLIDGLIMSAVGLQREEVESAAKGRALVLLDERIDHTTLDLVRSPNRTGGAAAGAHLVKQGCRRIIALGAGEEDVWSGTAGPNLRLQGLQEGLRQAAGDGQSARPISCSWSPDAARARLLEYIDSGEEFDGVFCMTDSVALGALRALADRQIPCPGQVKVIGFDGIWEGTYSVPTLSTVDIGIGQMAEAAVDLLVRRIEDQSDRPGQKVMADFTLFQRESTS